MKKRRRETSFDALECFIGFDEVIPVSANTRGTTQGSGRKEYKDMEAELGRKEYKDMEAELGRKGSETGPNPNPTIPGTLKPLLLLCGRLC